MTDFLNLHWVQRVFLILGGLILGILAERLIVGRARRIATRTKYEWDDLLVAAVKGLPTVWLASAGVHFALNVGAVDPRIADPIRSLLTVVVIGSAAIGAMRATGAAIQSVSARLPGSTQSPTLVVNLARAAVGVLAVFIILQNLGIDITPLIAALGIGGLAVALALQDTLGNLFAGVHIILSRQVRQKDFVQLSTGDQGWVTDIKGRNTTIQTFPDGNLVVVPNSLMASSILKNYSFPREALWVSIDVGVAYASDLEQVEKVTLEVARAVIAEVKGGMSEEDPVLVYQAFGDSSIDFQVRIMVDEFRAQGAIRHEFIKRLHRRYAAEGIEIPFPIRTVVMKGGAP